MAQIIWTEPAIDNLNEIAEYIAVSNTHTAKKLVETILDNVERLEQFSESGKKPEEIKELNYLKIVVNPCRIFYKAEQDPVYIMHELRQERDRRKFILSTVNKSQIQR